MLEVQLVLLKPVGVICTKYVDIKSAVDACGSAAVLKMNKSGADVCLDTNSDATLRDSDTLNLIVD